MARLKADPSASVFNPSSLPAPRHLEILRAAMRLMADKGFAGAGLRELAKRVGMSQPSLYHYFISKDELVEQIIFYLGGELLTRPGFDGFPETLKDVPPFLVNYVLRLYEDADYAVFIRFMLAISPHKPKYRNAIRRIYEDSFNASVPALMARFIDSGEITEEEARWFVRLVINSIGLLMIEKRVIYADKANSEDLLHFADFCGQALGFLAEKLYVRAEKV